MLSWLREDLADNAKSCTVAYFHDPLFSSGPDGNRDRMKPIWEALYAANVGQPRSYGGRPPTGERVCLGDLFGVAYTLLVGTKELALGGMRNPHLLAWEVRTYSRLKRPWSALTSIVLLGRWWRLGRRTAAKLRPDPVRKGSEADQHHEHTDNYSEHGGGPQDHIHNQADYQR